MIRQIAGGGLADVRDTQRTKETREIHAPARLVVPTNLSTESLDVLFDRVARPLLDLPPGWERVDILPPAMPPVSIRYGVIAD